HLGSASKLGNPGAVPLALLTARDGGLAPERSLRLAGSPGAERWCRVHKIPRSATVGVNRLPGLTRVIFSGAANHVVALLCLGPSRGQQRQNVGQSRSLP